MKATLEYNLPEEAPEHMDALNGTGWKLVVLNVDNLCRQALKHGHHLKSADAALEEIRRTIREEMDTHNLFTND